MPNRDPYGVGAMGSVGSVAGQPPLASKVGMGPLAGTPLTKAASYLPKKVKSSVPGLDAKGAGIGADVAKQAGLSKMAGPAGALAQAGQMMGAPRTPIGGAMTGGLSGAASGAAFGPVGAAIGGGLGAITGFMGGKGGGGSFGPGIPVSPIPMTSPQYNQY